MGRFTRLSLAASLLLALGGCGSMPDMPEIDPTEWFNVDFLSNKKPLPGVRKPVFPDGVPGVTQGVPPDLVQGYKPQPDPTTAEGQQQNAAGGAGVEQAAVEEPVREPPKPKAKPKPKPKRKVAAKPPVETEPEHAPTAVTVRRSNTPQPAAAQQQSGGGVQWPAPPGPQTGGPAPQASGPATVQWPDPPATH